VPSSLVFAGSAPPATLARRVARGELARLAPGVYTTEVADLPGAVRAEWRAIVGHLLPDAVITDRSAPLAGPVNGVLYLVRPTRTRDLRLPGLIVRTRRGLGPVDGDVPLPGGLHQASIPRGLLDNTLPSRSTGGRPARTLNERELGDWIDRIIRVYGARRLLEYRNQTGRLADELGADGDRLERLSDLLGAALGTRTVEGLESQSLAARQSGRAYDPERLARFDVLADALRAAAPQNRPADPNDPRWLHLPFFEAYFSNYIEGTEFPIDVAERIVYEGEVPPARPADAHDLTGTYEIVNDIAEMSAIADTADGLLEILRHRHRVVMGGRPETAPGEFKTQANRAGATEFVAPGLVEGTLTAGCERLRALDTAWERAVYTMFLISEVHPFNDGNGRIARIMMNAELVAGAQARIIVPTVFRDDYLGALRRLTRAEDPSILIKALRYAHDYTAAIDYASLQVAYDQLASTNAFEEPESERRLQLPSRSRAPARQRLPGTALEPRPGEAPRRTQERGPTGIGR
jgi:fido (protein-threonine AMPylation protein)